MQEHVPGASDTFDVPHFDHTDTVPKQGFVSDYNEEVKHGVGSEKNDFEKDPEFVPENNDIQSDQEIVIYHSEETVVHGPDMDGACDCGVFRPYFQTWLSLDEVEELRETVKRLSSRNLIHDTVLEENEGTISRASFNMEPAVEVDIAKQSETVQNGFESKNGKQESVTKTPDSSETKPLQRTPDIDSSETQIIKRTPDIDVATMWPPKFTIMDFMSAFFGLSFFLADVISDWRLTVLYFIQNEFTLFYVTLASLLVPALILSIISIIWSFMEYSYYQKLIYGEENDNANRRSGTLTYSTLTYGSISFQHSKIYYVLRALFSLIQLGRCFRLFEYMGFVIKSWREKNPVKDKNLRKQALQQKQDSAIFGLVDGFLGSALQFLLQLYLSISKQIPMDFPRVATICLSWISTAMLMTSFNRNNRKVQKKKRNAGYSASFFYLMWRICELGPRFIVLVLFAVTFKIWCAIPVSIHFSFMIVFYIWQKPELRGICCPGKKIQGYLFLLLMSYVGIFTYVNLSDGRTRYRLLVYYFIFYIENIIMSVLVLMYFPSDLYMMLPWKHCTYMLVPGFILHILFMLIYYRFFHPTKHVETGGGLKGRLKNVKVCGINII